MGGPESHRRVLRVGVGDRRCTAGGRATCDTKPNRVRASAETRLSHLPGLMNQREPKLRLIDGLMTEVFDLAYDFEYLTVYESRGD